MNKLAVYQAQVSADNLFKSMKCVEMNRYESALTLLPISKAIKLSTCSSADLWQNREIPNKI